MGEYQLGETCAQALHLITGARNEAYGDPRDVYWNTAIIAGILRNKKFDLLDVIAVHRATKLAREGIRHQTDNQVDTCGYADIWEYCHDHEAEKENPKTAGSG